jgi:transcriptional regulator GlxA family with amidase domain
LEQFRGSSAKTTLGRPSSWQLRQTLGYLEANFVSDVSLAKLAGLTGLSQSQFSHAFHASAGIAPYQWTLQARIRKAQELLAKAERPIAAIAIEVGFADQSHLTKVFRRQIGVTPKRWQRDRKIMELPERQTVERVRDAGL